MSTNLENSAVATGLEKGQFHFQSQRRGNAKKCSNYHTTALISHACKVILKILQARLLQYVNWELSDVQARFRKGRGTRNQIANTYWITEQESSRKPLLLHWLCQSLWLWLTINCWKFWKRWGCQTTWPASWEICMQVKKQQLEQTWTMDWFQIRKGVPQGCICNPAYLTYMQSTSC